MLGRIITAAAVIAGGAWAAKRMRANGMMDKMMSGITGQGMSGMSSVEETIEVEVPLSTAYNQFTQFEEFPQFMSSVHEVRQVDDQHLHWRASIAGKEKEWDSEITHQVPDRHIAWRSTSGVPNGGAVYFKRIGDNRTEVRLQMHYTPETFAERAADAVGAVRLQARQNLQKFKELLESRGHETGAWRGSVGAGSSKGSTGSSALPH